MKWMSLELQYAQELIDSKDKNIDMILWADGVRNNSLTYLGYIINHNI